MPDSFTCPRCDAKSHNPNDIAEGYCGLCHDWTGSLRTVTDSEIDRRLVDACGMPRRPSLCEFAPPHLYSPFDNALRRFAIWLLARATHLSVARIHTILDEDPHHPRRRGAVA